MSRSVISFSSPPGTLRPMTHPAPRFLFGLLLLSLSFPGHALTSFCVHDATELYTALAQAANSLDTPVIINIRKGTYDAADAPGSFAMVQTQNGQLVAISGGWSGDNGACTQSSKNAADTVLIGSASRRTLQLATGNTNPHSNNAVFVSDLTLRRPAGAGTSACLQVDATPGNSVTAQRLLIEQCVATSSSLDTVAGFVANGAQLSVANVVARNNQGVFLGGINVTARNGGHASLSQLSITANLADVGSPSVYASGLLLNADANGSGIELSNSVIWGNASDADSKDVSVSGPGISFNRVHYGGLKGTPAANLDPGTDDPRFVAAGDPHLRADSPLLDSGIGGSGSGSWDIEGGPRVVGGAVDVGAYEWRDAIFADGFGP